MHQIIENSQIESQEERERTLPKKLFSGFSLHFDHGMATNLGLPTAIIYSYLNSLPVKDLGKDEIEEIVSFMEFLSEEEVYDALAILMHHGYIDEY